MIKMMSCLVHYGQAINIKRYGHLHTRPVNKFYIHGLEKVRTKD